MVVEGGRDREGTAGLVRGEEVCDRSDVGGAAGDRREWVTRGGVGMRGGREGKVGQGRMTVMQCKRVDR